ncbi:hypothetical protein CRUP_032502, partial [Coryphaenoides rupestris]
CPQGYPGPPGVGSYAMGPGMQGYPMPMEQLQAGPPMPGQAAPSDLHMYMGQPPVYSPAPADVQVYHNQAGPPPGLGPGAMTQPPSYISAPSGQSLQPAPTDAQH